MKTMMMCVAVLAIAACENVPTAAEKECRGRHGLTVGSAEYDDCILKLKSSEHELRATR